MKMFYITDNYGNKFYCINECTKNFYINRHKDFDGIKCETVEVDAQKIIEIQEYFDDLIFDNMMKNYMDKELDRVYTQEFETLKHIIKE